MTFTVPPWLPILLLMALLIAISVYLAVKNARGLASVWIVGEFKGTTKRGAVIWELKGAFSARSAAVDACTDRRFFLARVPVDRPIPESGADLPRCEYPKAEVLNA